MPSNKDAYYFPHDSNAKDDPKCIMLIEQLGLEGYGIFWVLIETLRDQPTYRYPLKLIPSLARRFNTTTEKVNVVVHNYGLFQIEDDELFFSKSLDARMKFVEDKKHKAKLAADARWSKQMQKLCGSNANALPTESESNTNKRKEEKIKEDKTITTNSNVFKFFNENIGLITRFQQDTINNYLDDGIEEQMIVQAIKDSIGTDNPWKYLESILKNSFNKNILTFDNYMANKEKRKEPKEEEISESVKAYRELKRKQEAGESIV